MFCIDKYGIMFAKAAMKLQEHIDFTDGNALSHKTGENYYHYAPLYIGTITSALILSYSIVLD